MSTSIFLSFCLPHELSTSDERHRSTDEFSSHQIKCMHKFFRIDDFELTFETLLRDGLVTDEAQVHEPCAWIGVQCSNAIIQKLHWSPSTKPKRTACLAWIPPTVTSFDLIDGKASHVFSAKMLPRGLETINITQCRIDGTLDLTALPAPMTHFYGSMNNFTGTLVLENLPRDIKQIHTERSGISAVVFSNERLPVSLERFTCSRSKIKIQVIEEKGQKPDTRISVRTEDLGEYAKRRRGRRYREIA